MASRKIEDSTPALAMKCREWLALCAVHGIRVLITCTLRSLEEQGALYAQGREPLDAVNSKRLAVGLWKLTEAQNRIVTWTMESLHLPGPDGKARAFDFCILENGKATYNLKVDTDNDDRLDWEEAGRLGMAIGLNWGGRWTKKDYPHFQ